MTEHNPQIRRLKNGHPAHVFTDEDRRKGAAVTNEIRREKRLLLEQMRLNAEIERMWAADEARRQRRREKRRSQARIERYGRSELARPTDRDARSEAPPSANDPYEALPANERQALERGWTGEWAERRRTGASIPISRAFRPRLG